MKQLKWRDKATAGLIDEYDYGQYHVREYAERIAVARKDGGNMTWKELQAVKNNVVGPEAVAVEVYPSESQVVNLRNTRHLWFGPAIAKAVNAECRHPEFGNEIPADHQKFDIYGDCPCRMCRPLTK